MPPTTNLEILALQSKVASVFTPSAPIDRSALFAGRGQQVRKLMNAVSQKGQHAILFGERGVGKTSLANVLRDFLKAINVHGFLIGSTNCEGTSTFQSIWTAVLRDMPIEFKEVGMGFVPPVHTENGTLADLIPAIDSAESVRQLFQRIDKQCIVIIDEIDQIRVQGTAKALADTVKTLSDHGVNATIVLVGVADSVEDLIAEHLSIERALVQIQMPRMSLKELSEIIDKGLGEVGMSIEEEAKNRITKLSLGLPHYTHLLALHAAQSAVGDKRLNIDDSDVETAIQNAVQQAQQSIVSGYVQATSSRRGNLYAQVLTACAQADKDVLGYFSSSDVRDPMSAIMGKRYDIPAFSQHLNDFCEDDRGPILERTGYPRRYRFRFCNPLMEPYVIMSGISKGLITKNVPTNHSDDPASELELLS
jgi:Cdc6-like AAA superfamily ATPase